MQTTSNLGLRKPSENDFINVEDLNHNAEKLDEKVQAVIEGIEDLSGLKDSIQLTTDREFVNSLINNTAKPGSVLLFSNVGERYGNVTDESYTLYAGLMNCNRYSGCDITVKPVNSEIEQSLHPMYFQVPAYFIAKVDKNNAKRVTLYPVSSGDTDEIKSRLDNVEAKANQAFTQAHEGKQLLADALVSKQQIVSSSASFSEIANKIREIRVGKYNVGDWIEGENLKFYKYNNYSNRIITSAVPNSKVIHGCFLKLKGELCYLVLSGIIVNTSYGNPSSSRVMVGYQKINYNHLEGTLSNNDGYSIRDTRGKTNINIPVYSEGNYWDINNLEVTDENIFLTFRGKIDSKKKDYILMIVADWSGNFYCKKEFYFPGLSSYHIFHQEKVFTFYSQANASASYFSFNSSDIVHKRTLNTTMSSGEFMFFLSPYGYYTAKTESGSNESKRRVIRFYDGSSVRVVGSVYGNSLDYASLSTYSSSPVNSYFHRFYFKLFGTINHNEGVKFYELDYKNHTIKIIDSTSRTSSSSEYFIKNCRFFPSGYIYDGYANNVIIYLPPDKSNTSHRQHSMRAQFSEVEIDKNCELVIIDDAKVFFMYNSRSDGIGYGYMRCNWNGVEVKK